MGTIVSSSLISKAQTLLQDTAGTRWTSTELLGWLNDGQREIVLLKPDANTSSSTHALTAGTKQALPNAGITLVDVTRNVTGTGAATGTTIKHISRKQMDAQIPTWHSSATGATVKYFMFDPRNPKEFYVYPPSAGANHIELVYSAAPATISVATAVIGLDDIYANALVDYMLYRAFSKDADFAANTQRAISAYGVFAQALGLKETAEAAAEAVV